MGLEYTAQQVQEEVQQVTQVLTATAGNLSSNPAVWILFGGLLYKWLTKPVPLMDHPTDVAKQDLKRYELMCANYLRILKKPNIPIHWHLREGCPTHSTKLSDSAEQFRVRVMNIRDSGHQMKSVIVGMISYIERLYESLQKRSRIGFSENQYREDGYESMFFTDLVQWLSSDLPIEPITSPKTAERILDRINYCKEIYTTVFIYRKDPCKNNPRDILSRIIASLESLYKDVQKTIEAASFNAQIQEIDNNLTDMVVNAFNICHLILNDVNQRELQVAEFLDPLDSNPKVKTLTQLTMGQWIINTLNDLGIKQNNYVTDGREIKIDAISSYLSSIEFSQLPLSSTGLPEFIYSDPNKSKKENQVFALSILNKIINVHREIKKIYVVKSSLVNAALVGVNFGECWLYGNDEGKIVVRALFSVISDISTEFKNTLHDFWNAFFEDAFDKYARREHLSPTNPIYNVLQIANKRFLAVVENHSNIGKAVSALRTKSEQFANDAEVTRKTKRVLISGLYEILRRRANADKTIVEALSKLVEKEEANTSVVNNTTVSLVPVAIEPYIISYPKAALPSFTKSHSLLVEKISLQEHQLKLMPDPGENQFHTPTQKYVYKEFLVPYHSVVNYGMMYSAVYSFTTFSMSDLREFYSRINMIMTDLYSEATLERSDGKGLKDPAEKNAQKEAVMAKSEEEDIFYYLHKGSVTPWSTELMMVDQHLRIAMHNFSKIFRDNPMARPLKSNDFQILDIKLYGENVEVSIDRRLLAFAAGAFAHELEVVKSELACEKKANEILREQNAALIGERDIALADLKKRDILLEENAKILTALKLPSGTHPNSSPDPLSSNRNGFHKPDKHSKENANDQVPTP